MKKKTINLALQGGGAHGAFTWGVLDKFLETQLFKIEGISATSAGSMNAVMLLHGLLHGGENAARQSLEKFWKSISVYGEMLALTTSYPADFFLKPFLSTPVSLNLLNAMTGLLSPYQFNPLNFHPIKEVLQDNVDFEAIKKQKYFQLFIGATNVRTGKIRVFNTQELSMEVVIASACLPKLFQAVAIGDDFYWDGGYLGNPAIYPLIYETNCKDVLIIHTFPIVRQEVPHTALDIDSRLREISFNSSLMREMRAIAFTTKLIEQGWIKPEFEKKLKKVRMHCIRADESLHDFSSSTVYNSNWNFLIQLRDIGRQAADTWIHKHFNDINKKTTIHFDDWL